MSRARAVKPRTSPTALARREGRLLEALATSWTAARHALGVASPDLLTPRERATLDTAADAICGIENRLWQRVTRPKP